MAIVGGGQILPGNGDIQPTPEGDDQKYWQSTVYAPGVPRASDVPGEQRQDGRRWDYTTWYNYTWTPRDQLTKNGKRLSQFEELYAVVTLCNMAKMAIKYKVNESQRVRFSIVPRTGNKKDAKSLEPNIQRVTRFWQKPDGRTYWSNWRARYVRDIYTYDALSMLKMRDPKTGDFAGLRLLDGSTIRPRIDPLGDPVAFTQVIRGLVYANFHAPGIDPDMLPFQTDGELVYRPRWPGNDSPYGNPPAEDIMDTLYTAIEHQEYHKAYWQDGAIGDLIVGIPRDVSGQQLQDLRADLRDLYAGDHAARHGWQPISINNDGNIRNAIYEPRQFNPDIKYWSELRRIVWSAFGVLETEMGFTEKTGKTTNNSQEDVKDRDTLSQCLWDKEFFDDVIQSPDMLNEPELETQWDFDKIDDQLIKAQKYQITRSIPDDATGPVILNSEIRSDMFPDLEPVDLTALAQTVDQATAAQVGGVTPDPQAGPVNGQEQEGQPNAEPGEVAIKLNE